MFEYFYNEILRRTIIGFGTLFNSISIKQSGGDTDASVIRVPLAYGPTQKFLARLTQSPDLNKATSLSLPRMSFEFTGLTYDPSRKVTTTQKIVVQNPDSSTPDEKKVYMPVPYNMQFELAVMCKLNDDALQIVEQILPYFQPSYNLSVNLVGSINEKRDIPVILENITMQDDYEGDFESRRVLLYTLRFTAKTYLFGPSAAATKDLIRSARVSYLAGTDTTNTQRDLTYSVTPRATKSYGGPITTTLDEDVDLTEVEIKVVSTSNIFLDPSEPAKATYCYIDEEEMKITMVNTNSIIVERAQDNTLAASHVKGSAVRVINPITSATDTVVTYDDNALIEDGDNFGFDGTIS